VVAMTQAVTNAPSRPLILFGILVLPCDRQLSPDRGVWCGVAWGTHVNCTKVHRQA
jgi:hypothetical protein